MKNFLIFSLFSLFSLLFVGCEAVEPLSYGVKYDPCSSTLSRDNLTVVYGKFNMCGACCEVSDFPSTPQVKSFQRAESETSEANSHFTVPIGTSSVEFDYNIEFQIKSEEDAKKCFMSCKAGKDFDSYVRNNMKNNLRDIFKNVMRNFKSPEALIDSTGKFETLCFIEIEKRLAEDGITASRANLINNFRWPANVAKTLEEIITIKAKTMMAESQARAAELESKARMIQSKANSEADIIEAEAKRKIAEINADIKATEIKKINLSLTPQYLKMLEIENYTYKTELVTPQGVYRISQKED